MRAILFVALLAFLSEPLFAQQIAFPGAVGYGRLAQGGRGGAVYEVTTLLDAVPAPVGSLRACIEAMGPRTCVFRVAGTIISRAPLEIANPYITIAGQTAPAPGITLETDPCGDWPVLKVGVPISSDQQVSAQLLNASHTIIRYLRLHSEDKDECLITGQAVHSSTRDGIWVRDQTGPIIIDHVSIRYGGDENVGWDVCQGTVQWSIMAWGLTDHSKALRGSGPPLIFPSTIGGGPYDVNNVDFQHCGITTAYNLYAHNSDRGPEISYYPNADMINTYSYGFDSEIGEYRMVTGQIGKFNYVGNVAKASQEDAGNPLMHLKPQKVLEADPLGDFQIYAPDNIPPPGQPLAAVILHYFEPNTGPWFPKPVDEYFVATPHVFTHPMPPAYPAADILNTDVLLGHVGVSVPFRDRADTYLIDYQIPSALGRLVSTHRSVNQTSTDAMAYVEPFRFRDFVPAPADSDHDGMPDYWEAANPLLDRYDPADGPLDLDGDGWTELEEYLNALAAPGFPPPP